MTRESRLPKGGANLFQGIKAICAQAEASGKPSIDMSIGQPKGPAFLEAQEATAKAVMSDAESMHEYQDNGSPGVPGFAKKFVQAHVRMDVGGLECLPVPGIKAMLGLIPLACGASKEHYISVLTDPGYPTPDVWCEYLGVAHKTVSLGVKNKFRFNPGELSSGTDLLMTNYPHNPSGQVAIKEWWGEICERAQRLNIRIFNDGAYSRLVYTGDHCTLTDVAARYPKLSWAEAFSSSKAGNFTGWRIGAITGSKDFVDDIATIKGQTDSGFFAPAAVGVLEVFERHPHLIEERRDIYRRRSAFLISALKSHGMRLAVQPAAGFFTLWQTPARAFGKEIKDAEHFNYLMIERTGVVGVHFPPYIRYAVCGDVEASGTQINEAFREAHVEYI